MPETVTINSSSADKIIRGEVTMNQALVDVFESEYDNNTDSLIDNLNREAGTSYTEEDVELLKGPLRPRIYLTNDTLLSPQKVDEITNFISLPGISAPTILIPGHDALAQKSISPVVLGNVHNNLENNYKGGKNPLTDAEILDPNITKIGKLEFTILGNWLAQDLVKKTRDNMFRLLEIKKDKWRHDEQFLSYQSNAYYNGILANGSIKELKLIHDLIKSGQLGSIRKLDDYFNDKHASGMKISYFVTPQKNFFIDVIANMESKNNVRSATVTDFFTGSKTKIFGVHTSS